MGYDPNDSTWPTLLAYIFEVPPLAFLAFVTSLAVLWLWLIDKGTTFAAV